MLAARDLGQPVEIVDPDVVPETIAFDRRPVRAGRNPAADADLRLGSPAAVAEQGPRVVATADGIIASGEFLEAEQRLPRILRLRAESQGQLGNGPELAIGGRTDDGRRGAAFDAAGGDVRRAAA